jgi:hypothetical protein
VTPDIPLKGLRTVIQKAEVHVCLGKTNCMAPRWRLLGGSAVYQGANGTTIISKPWSSSSPFISADSIDQSIGRCSGALRSLEDHNGAASETKIVQVIVDCMMAVPCSATFSQSRCQPRHQAQRLVLTGSAGMSHYYPRTNNLLLSYFQRPQVS